MDFWRCAADSFYLTALCDFGKARCCCCSCGAFTCCRPWPVFCCRPCKRNNSVAPLSSSHCDRRCPACCSERSKKCDKIKNVSQTERNQQGQEASENERKQKKCCCELSAENETTATTTTTNPTNSSPVCVHFETSRSRFLHSETGVVRRRTEDQRGAAALSDYATYYNDDGDENGTWVRRSGPCNVITRDVQGGTSVEQVVDPHRGRLGAHCLSAISGSQGSSVDSSTSRWVRHQRFMSCSLSGLELEKDEGQSITWFRTSILSQQIIEEEEEEEQEEEDGRLAEAVGNDELPRMGSIQSDSSGFGDTEPGLENAPVEYEVMKIGSLGSSSESNGTLASSATTAVLTTPRTGEMATQTLVDGTQMEIIENQDLSSKLSDMSTDYKRESANSGNISQDFEGEEQRYTTTCFIPSVSGSSHRNDSRSHHSSSWHDSPRDNNLASEQHTPIKVQVHTDKRLTGSGNPMSFVLEVKRNSDNVKQNAVSGERTPLSRHSSKLSDHEHSSSSLPRSKLPQPYLSSYEHSTNSQNYVVGSSPNVVLLRNNIPLSEELANARGVQKGHSDTPVNSSSSLSVKSTPDFPPTTSTPASFIEDDKKNTISSITMYISPKESNSASSYHSLPRSHPTIGSAHKPVAGNLSGLGHSTVRTTSSVSHSDQTSDREVRPHRTCDILEDDDDVDFDDDVLYPAGFSADMHALSYSPRRLPTSRSYHSSASARSDLRPYTNSNPRHSFTNVPSSRTLDDLEAYSSMAESSSDFSTHSTPEGPLSSGPLNAQKLARLINKPVIFRGKQTALSHYRPRRSFREWHVLNKRKRLQEENRLLQHSIQKYKAELDAMERSFLDDYRAVYDDLTDEERADVEELEFLWDEVRMQVSEMEQLLMSRIKSVHSGNEFYSLLSNMGVISKTIDLVKEQMYQQQIASMRIDHPEHEDSPDQLHQGSNLWPPQERMTFLPSRHYKDDPVRGVHYPQRSFSHHAQSASMSNLPASLNVSLDQIKSSLFKEMKDEIKASTQKLEGDLMEKEKQIQALKEQLQSATSQKDQSVTASKASKTSSAPWRRSWEPKTEIRGHRRSRSRSRLMGDRIVTETDV